jgi:hypothetical protein
VNPAVFGSHSGQLPAGFYQFPEWVPDSSGISLSDQEKATHAFL